MEWEKKIERKKKEKVKKIDVQRKNQTVALKFNGGKQLSKLSDNV